ncbi:MAG: hypothetical protein ACE5FI_05760, partial [Anaerolineales bacterium]
SAVQPVAYAQPAMAALQPQATAAPPAAAQAQPVPASKKKGGAVKKAGGTARIFVSMASTLGSLLPGAAGKPFTDFSRRAQETQAQAQMAKDKQRMVQREVKSLGDQSKKLGGSTGGGAAKPAPAATPPATPAPPPQPVAPRDGVSPAHQPTPVAVAPAPAGNNGRGGAPAAARTITRNLEWALTPVIEAGESLTLNLQITPTGTPDSQSYFFKLLSRPAEADDVPVAVEQGSADLTRPNILLRLLPFAVLVVGVVAVGVLARFLLLEFGILA